MKVVTYWWGSNIYKNKAKKYKEMCKSVGVSCYVEKLKVDKGYQNNINHKPDFILECLKKFKKGVLYTDLDMKIHRYPRLYENKENNDVILFNWNYDPRVNLGTFDPYTLETSGGASYWNYSKNSIRLLKLWSKALKTKYKGRADDRVLSIMYHNNKAKEWIKAKWVPVEYFYIPEFYKHLKLKNIVISHPCKITEEEKATEMGSHKDRIPPDYEKVRKAIKHHKKYEEFLYEEPEYKMMNLFFKQNKSHKL